MKLRQGDDPEQEKDFRRERSRWGMSHEFSIADLATIVAMFVGGIYTVAVQGTKIDQTAHDLQDVRSWIQNHAHEDGNTQVLLDQRLRHIEEKLDTLIGEVDGNGNTNNDRYGRHRGS